MRLATRALTCALVLLVLCAAVLAQTRRSPDDPRNQSPSVGTGGPEGGPTGLLLFTTAQRCAAASSRSVLLTATMIVTRATLTLSTFRSASTLV